MFDIAQYDDRLIFWAKFRQDLVVKENKAKIVVELYSKAPLSTLSCDPWDKNTWPTPWELIYNNCYCSFTLLLGIGFTFLLADLCNTNEAKIFILQDKKSGQINYCIYAQYYFTYDNDGCLCYDAKISDEYEILYNEKLD